MKVDEIKTIVDNDKSYAVEDLPPHVRDLLPLYTEWQQKSADLKNELLMIDSALNFRGHQIIEAIRQWQRDLETSAEIPVEN